MIEWEYVAAYLENQRGETNPLEAKEWLEDHKHIIDWTEFDLWVEQVKDKEGYEWLLEVFEMWEAEKGHKEEEEDLDWDVVAK